MNKLAASLLRPPMQDVAQRNAALPAAEIAARTDSIDRQLAPPVEEMQGATLRIPEGAVIRPLEARHQPTLGRFAQSPGQGTGIEAGCLDIGAIDDQPIAPGRA